ncbi:MAG: hypothetical protein JWM32_2671 [Verrucomicrobia bacterium]|nr:hypothetical protein [Verrucomicrobiota bacterium]
MKTSRPTLYTKIGCPWCAEARAILDREAIAYDDSNPAPLIRNQLPQRTHPMTLSPTENSAATIAGAQREMRFAYYGGAPGMFTSATVWLIAGIVSIVQSPERAVWALFIGGVFIHPVSGLLTKAMGRSGKHSAGNPFGSLALATTFWMILALPLAYGVSRLRIEWFFPAMLFIIGGRYLTFSTIFGARTYWFCGAALALAGFALGRANASPTFGAFSGAAIEAMFAVTIFVEAVRLSVFKDW